MKRFAETEVAPDDALAAAPGCIAPTASKLHPVLRVSGDPLRSNARFAALLQVPSGQKKYAERRGSALHRPRRATCAWFLSSS